MIAFLERASEKKECAPAACTFLFRSCRSFKLRLIRVYFKTKMPLSGHCFFLAESEDYEPKLSKPSMSISYTANVVKGSRKCTTILKGNACSLSRADLR